MLRSATVCSGIGGWEQANPDMQHVWASEIEPFPAAVLAERQGTPNAGDMTKIATGETDLGPIDLLCGGTPCQSFSVAGLRKGLADPRGNLAVAYLEIARRYQPKWLVWENVPGVLSSNGGRDFGSILGGMVQLGYGVAYRVLDAQYFGVPQRRRRVFVVGCLGDWRGAAAVLFERHSLSGNPAPRREAREKVADSLTVGANQYSGFVGEPVAQCVTTGTGQRYDAESETLVATPIQEVGERTEQSTDDPRAGIGIAKQGDPMFTLQAGAHHAVAFTGDVTHALNTANNGKMSSEDGTGRGVPTVALSNRGNDTGEVAETLRSDPHGAHPMVAQTAAVRRLTPAECEALQGFPRGYTNIPGYNPRYTGPYGGNKGVADGPRYKALGNSMAVPVVRWIGERIDAVRAIQDENQVA